MGWNGVGGVGWGGGAGLSRTRAGSAVGHGVVLTIGDDEDGLAGASAAVVLQVEARAVEGGGDGGATTAADLEQGKGRRGGWVVG